MTVPTFDGTITLGNVLTIIAVIGSAIFYVGQVIRRLAKIELKLNLMWSAFKHEHHLTENGEQHVA